MSTRYELEVKVLGAEKIKELRDQVIKKKIF